MWWEVVFPLSTQLHVRLIGRTGIHALLDNTFLRYIFSPMGLVIFDLHNILKSQWELKERNWTERISSPPSLPLTIYYCSNMTDQACMTAKGLRPILLPKLTFLIKY